MPQRSDYEALSDVQLEDLMVRYRIPPARKIKQSGEHFVFDREHVIQALVSRDLTNQVQVTSETSNKQKTSRESKSDLSILSS